MTTTLWRTGWRTGIVRSTIVLLAASLGGGTLVAGAASAQSYPSKPITLVVPFPAGGPNDAIARVAAQLMASRLRQNVIIDNRVGAGGTVGLRAVARAEPDGYTLLLGSLSSLAIAPAFYANAGYDPVTSFAPIAMVSEEPQALAVRPGLPVRSVGDLVAYAKASPGTLNFGGTIGTLSHLTGELFKSVTGADIVYVPYKGGAQALTDVLGGQTEMIFLSASALMGLVHDGKLRALAVTGATRIAELPDAPTMIESGYPRVLVNFWTGILAPAGTPPEIVARLAAAISDGLKLSDANTTISKLAPKQSIPPQAFASFIADEVQKWAAIVKSSGAKID